MILEGIYERGLKMDKKEVIEFFDKQAPTWDERMVRNENAIATILYLGGVHEGCDVLDVACGTGVLFNDYLKLGVNSVTGVDISPEMVRIAKANYNDSKIEVICADIEEKHFDKQFDVCMIYNAFPHFTNYDSLIEHMASLTKKGGRFTVAHGMSREDLHIHHSGQAVKVSLDLPDLTELSAMFSLDFDVDCCISNNEMYMVSGTRR